MSSTPKHLALYQAFDWQPPHFAHVGLLLDKNRQKLSKRTGSVDIQSWRREGIFPETLTNFVALLGWSHNTGQDVMNMEDLIHNTSMKYTRGDTIVAFEKLMYLQKRHTARYASLPPPENPLRDLKNLATIPIVELLDLRFKNEKNCFYSNLPTEKTRINFVHQIVLADAQNYKTPTDFIDRNQRFFVAPSEPTLFEAAPSMHLRKVPLSIPPTPSIEIFLNLLKETIDLPFEGWNDKELRERLTWMIEQGKQVSMAGVQTVDFEELDEGLEKKVYGAWSKLTHSYLRWALLGGASGPDGADTMRILGKEECEKRFLQAEEVIRAVCGDGVQQVRTIGVDV
jgi:glutamyl-tRNA synthetase